jgi:hypothetical protein
MKLFAAAAIVVLTLFADAQPLRFGADAPLPNTRYGTAPGDAKLVAAGADLYAFWTDGINVRMTKLAAGERRGGVAVLTIHRPHAPGATGAADAARFDVVWTGAHFLVAGGYEHVGVSRSIVTRTVGLDSQPLTAPLTVATDGMEPVLAWNGRTALLLYTTLDSSNGVSSVRSLPLTSLGMPTAAGGELVFNGLYKAVASNGNTFAAIASRGNETWLVTFDANGRMRTWVSAGDLAVDARNLTIASNGNDYLAVLTNPVELSAIPVQASGAAGARVVLDRRLSTDNRLGFFRPAMTWTGSGWTVTYSEFRTDNATADLHIATLDANGAPRTFETVAGWTGQSVVNVGGRVATAFWPAGDPRGTPAFSYLPLAENTPTDLAHSAAEQRLLATASSKTGILVVWREFLNGDFSMHAGIRLHTGDWIERPLDIKTGSALAASDGTTFLVVVNSTAYRFDERLTQLGPELKLPINAEAMASNGSVYAIAGGRKGVTVTSSGTVGPVVSLTQSTRLSFPSIASDGQNFLIAWAFDAHCELAGCMGARGVTVERYDSELRRIAGSELSLTSDATWWPHAAWNGRDFDVTWYDFASGIVNATVPSSGAPVMKVVTPRTDLELLGTTGLRDGTAMVIREFSVTDRYVTRVLALDRSGLVRQSDPIDHAGSVVTAEPRLVILADGRLAYLTSRHVTAAPQHGSSHVTFAIDSATPPPAAPRLTATADGRNVRLTWTAAAGAAGYRVEYKINDGTWNELERWFGPVDRITTIRLNGSNDRAAFRVRAWSDGGTGPYSAAVVVNAGKRRSVR